LECKDEDVVSTKNTGGVAVGHSTCLSTPPNLSFIQDVIVQESGPMNQLAGESQVPDLLIHLAVPDTGSHEKADGTYPFAGHAQEVSSCPSCRRVAIRALWTQRSIVFEQF